MSVAGNHTLVADWTINTYTVTYDANGGTGSTSTSSHTYDQSRELSKNGFSRHGWTFLGWSTSSSATSATYTDGQSVKNLTATNNGNVKLYAVWKLNTVGTFAKSYIDVPSVGEYGAEGNLTTLFDLNALIAGGYKYKVTIKYDLKVDGDHLYAKTWLTVAGRELFNSGEVYYGNNASGSPTHTVSNRSASELSGNSTFKLMYDAIGMSIFDVLNHFEVRNLSIVFEFYK